MLVWIQFLICTVVIVYGGSRLSHYGDVIAEKTGMGRTWIGVVLMASATSLPEIAVCKTALRMGAVDMAVDNVLGSNLFNLLILAINDGFFLKGPLSPFISPTNALTACAAMIMTAISMIALVYRSKKRVLAFSWDSIGVFLVYSVTVLLLFLKR